MDDAVAVAVEVAAAGVESAGATSLAAVVRAVAATRVARATRVTSNFVMRGFIGFLLFLGFCFVFYFLKNKKGAYSRGCTHLKTQTPIVATQTKSESGY